MPISSEAKQEVERLLRNGQKIQAIKYLCDTFQISLEDGKKLVDAVDAEAQIPIADLGSNAVLTPTALSGDIKMEVLRLLRANLKLEAVKYVRLQTQAGLKEALTMVEEVEREINPNAAPSKLGTGCLKMAFKSFSFIFGLIAFLLLLIAGVIYYLDEQAIAKSVKINGRVVELISNGDAFAPAIQYNLNGKDYRYQSTSYTNPSAYDMNEVVPMFVDPENPEEAIPDTFSDRWLAITILGGLGLFFAFFAFITAFSSRRF